jgi:hypothetical protein
MALSDFEEVMAALRDGQRFQIGGGRCFPTYAMKQGQVVVIHSDDGYTEERPCDEEMLRRAIAEAPHCFQQIIEWRNAQPHAPSWPPTPDPPTSIADAESTLRQGAPGPPPFGDDDPWDFIFRWPDEVVETMVWPAVSHLLVDGDPEVRERAIWFSKVWRVERQRSLERLIEVATLHAELYRAAGQIETLTLGLADLSCSLRSEQPRIAKLILTVLGDAPPCRGGVTIIAEYEPLALVERAPRWGEGWLDQSAVQEAVSAMAIYRPDHLLELLAALSSRSPDHRTPIMAALSVLLSMTDEQRAFISNAEGVPPPQRPCPTLDECRAALGLG